MKKDIEEYKSSLIKITPWTPNPLDFESEKTEVKNIEWLKKEVGTEMIELEPNRAERWADVKYQTLRNVAQKINQLDEPETLSIDKEQLIKKIENYIPLHDKTVGDVVDGILEIVKQLPEMEVLSPKWIDDNTQLDMNPTSRVVPAFLLENILVPKQDLPVIPKYVGEFIEEVKASGDRLDVAFSILRDIYHQSKTANWVAKENRNYETFARAWLDGYTVEEEPKYYAKLKEVRPPEKEWLTNLSGPNYYALDTKGLMLGEFILDLVVLKTEASTHTLKDWERYGINDSNADFVEVAE